MKNHTAKIPGTIFARRNFTPVSLFPHLVLPLVAGWLAGCSSLSDYMSQPMIIDASQRQVPSVKWEDRYENHPNPDNPSPANNAIAGDPQTDSRESAPESGQAEQNPLAASQPPQNSNTGSATADQPDYTQNNALVKRTATDSPGQPLQPDPPPHQPCHYPGNIRTGRQPEYRCFSNGRSGNGIESAGPGPAGFRPPSLFGSGREADTNRSPPTGPAHR